MSKELELLRDDLYEEIDLYGLEYEKLIVTDCKLHEAILKEMRAGWIN